MVFEKSVGRLERSPNAMTERILDISDHGARISYSQGSLLIAGKRSEITGCISGI
jgi:hypothetical protein